MHDNIFTRAFIVVLIIIMSEYNINVQKKANIWKPNFWIVHKNFVGRWLYSK